MVFLGLSFVELFPVFTIFGSWGFWFDLYFFIIFRDDFLTWFLYSWTFIGDKLCWLLDRDLYFGDNLSSTIKRFRDDIFISKTQIHWDVISSLSGIVITSSITTIEIVISFKPLNELKVVLIFSFSQFLNIDISFNTCFLEGSLKDFEVVDELILSFGFPVDFGHVNFAWMDNINNLAVDWTSSKLFYFGGV